jgi:Skp family chaperone for outer membrane proteins
MEGALNAMLLTKLRSAVLACGLFASGAFMVAQQAGRPSESRAQPVKAAALPNPAEPSETPDDGAALETAVNRDMARLDIELLREEVKSYEDHVRKAFRAKVYWEMPGDEAGRLHSQTNQAEALKHARSEYEDARSAYREKLRELMIAIRRQADSDSTPGMMGQSGRRTAAPKTAKSAPPPGGAAVGSLDMDAVMKRYHHVQKLKEQLTRDREAWKERVAKSEIEFKELGSVLERVGPGTSLRNDLEEKIAASKQRMETDREQAESDLTRRQARMTADLIGEIQAATAAVAEAKGLGYVVKISKGPLSEENPNAVNDALKRSVIYANPKNDITEEVIREQNRKFDADPGRPSS